MKRTTLNLTVDALAYVSLLGLTGTGLLIRWVLPPRTGGRLAVWGWNRHDWGDLHFYFVIAFAAFVLVHLILHWAWICAAVGRLLRSNTVGKRRGVRLGLALGALTLLTPAAFLWLTRANVQSISGRHAGRNAEPTPIEFGGRRSLHSRGQDPATDSNVSQSHTAAGRHQRLQQRRRSGWRSRGNDSKLGSSDQGPGRDSEESKATSPELE